MHRGLLIYLLLVTVPAVAAGQSIKRGSHVRVWTNRHLLVQGSVTSVSDEAIVVDTLRIPIDSISQLRRRYHKDHAGRGAVIGGVTLGALSGIVAFGACGFSTGGGLGDCSESAHLALAAAAVVGFTFGAGIGALIGAFVRTELWQGVYLDHLRVAVVPQQDRPSLGLSLSF